MRALKKIKAGALQYVIFISIVIALIISLFILLVSLNNQFKYKSQQFQNLILETQNGFEFAKQQQFYSTDTVFLKSDNELVKTVITNSYWGIYQRIQVSSSFKNQTFKKTALLGGYTKQKLALYLQENHKPLVLVGDTEITGQAFLPSQGVKRGMIAGHSFNGKQLIYGNSLRSRRHLPKITNRKQLQNLCKGIVNIPVEMFTLKKSSFDKSNYTNSFNMITKIYKSNGAINLKNINLSGNYIIQSNTAIQIFKTANLKDVLLIAPNIQINKAVIGNFQAFATESITIEEKCQLNYPTALVLAEKTQTNPTNTNIQTENHTINIGSDAKITGTVCFLTNDKKDNHKAQIITENNSLIQGEVYCEKNMSHSGVVTGTVYTNSFITNAFGSIYHNHIYNGIINSTLLPQEFSGLLFKKNTKNTVQWIY